jgi:cytochrome b561
MISKSAKGHFDLHQMSDHGGQDLALIQVNVISDKDVTYAFKHQISEVSMSIRSVPGYTGFQIALHWLIAALVLLQLIFGESIAETIKSAERGTAASIFDQFFAGVHYWAGIAILALVAMRLWIRAVAGAPSPLQDGWMATTAKVSHALFYILLIMMPILGLLAYYIGDPYGDLHELGKPILIILIALHACGSLYHQFWLKDGTLRRIFVPRS